MSYAKADKTKYVTKKCKHKEYPWIGYIIPLQRMSSSVEELAILRGASWDYVE